MYMKYLALILIISLIACNKPIDDAPPIITNYVSITKQYQTINDVSENLSSLDIYYFDTWSELKPVVIYVHGGGWAIGDKSNSLDNKTKLFDSLGYVFISVNYRLSPFPYQPDNPNRIKNPTHVKDVAKAVKYIYDNIENYGGNNNKMAIMGHSAGAHIVSLLSTDSRHLSEVGLEMNTIKGVISLDTQAYDINTVMESSSPSSSTYKMYINAFGNDAESWKEASPTNFISTSIVENWFVVYRGTASRVANQLSFIDAIENTSKNTIGIYAESYSHSDVNDVIGDENDQVINVPVVAFLMDILE